MSARLLCASLILIAGCSTPFDPARVPRDAEHVVLIKSARLPGKFGPVIAQAHHAWFELKGEGGWEIVEVLASAPVQFTKVLRRERIDFERDVLDGTRWRHPVQLLQVLEGRQAKRVARMIRGLADAYEDPAFYWAWPGPNSNTFVERVVRRCPELEVELHHNAIAKDWALLRVGPSATRSGVEVETPILGLQLGLEEGLELHVLQMTFGVDLWPPALKLPFLPRLGFPQHGAW